MKSEFLNEQRSKRHGAAALQDAGATDCGPLGQRGYGVRPPHAAFVATGGGYCSAPPPWERELSLLTSSPAS